MKRSRNTLGPLIGYHGCDRKVAEAALSGKTPLKPSQNDYDWLGPGVYFWVDSAERGLDWARELATRPRSRITDPYVIGAFIHPGLCFNLTDYGVAAELLDAYHTLSKTLEQTGTALPKNAVHRDGVYLNRALDCAVIKTVHKLRMEAGDAPYDTVYGVFEEGPALYPNAGFKKKTHVQIAVIEPECVLGYFRVPGLR